MQEPKRRRSSLTQISKMLEGTLKRHGITKQVTAAIIVERAKEILAEMVAGTPLEDDVRVASYAAGILIVGCANSPATFDINGMIPTILARIQSEIPEADITKIIARVQIEKGNF